MAKLTKEQQEDIKARIRAILEQNDCHLEIKNFRAGPYDVYDIDTVEFMSTSDRRDREYVFILLYSKVPTGTIRKPFKPTRQSYRPLQPVFDAVKAVLSEYGFEEDNNDVSTMCTRQYTYVRSTKD